MKNINILGIETSCDETSASVVKNGRDVLSNVVSSQIELHKLFGGVVPEIASRKHVEKISFVIEEALRQAELKFEDIDAVAVTKGPGLVGALLVGISAAKALSFSLKKPLVGVHHLEGHISANYIQNKEFKPPFLCLIVSGGHTHLVKVLDYGKYEILGCTRDDAAGEAFDKVARAIGLGYPGGPKIDKKAKEGKPIIDFPRTILENYDFSFSGIKSSVLNHINTKKMKNEDINKENIAASFQKAVVDVLIKQTMKAAKQEGISKIAVAGGVGANSLLRNRLSEVCKREKIILQMPDIHLCTDNAAMIASAGYYNFINNKIDDLSLNATPNLKLGN